MDRNLLLRKNVIKNCRRIVVKAGTRLLTSEEQIAKLVEGQQIDEVVSKLQGITCGFKSTSCPDQLATALKQIKEKL